jgi:hypothetical protein
MRGRDICSEQKDHVSWATEPSNYSFYIRHHILPYVCRYADKSITIILQTLDLPLRYPYTGLPQFLGTTCLKDKSAMTGSNLGI